MRQAAANPAFRRIISVYVGDQIIDWASMVALMLLVYRETESALATALLLVTKNLLPAMVVPVVSRRCDRLPVRHTATAAMLVCACALAGLAAAPLVALWPLVVVFEIGALLARSSVRGALPLVLAGDTLRVGNGLVNTTSALLAASGPAIAAAGVVAFGPHTILLVAAAVAVITALLATGLPGVRPHDLPDEAETSSSSTRRLQITGRAGVALALGAAAVVCVFSMDEPVLVAFVSEALGQGEREYGLLVSAWGLGLLAGSAGYLRVRHIDPARLALTGCLALSGGYLALGIATTLTAAAAAATVCGIANGVTFTAFVNVVQEAVPPARQARAASWIEAIGAGGAGIGFLAGGALASLASPRLPFLVGGVLGVLLTFALFALTLRAAQPARPA